MQTLVAPSDVDHESLRRAAVRVTGNMIDPAALIVIPAVAVCKHQRHGSPVLTAEERAELATLAAHTWLSLEQFTDAAIGRARQLLDCLLAAIQIRAAGRQKPITAR